MPRHPDFEKIYQRMINQYGKKKGKEVYYAYINKNKFDDTKPFPKKLKEKNGSLILENQYINWVEKVEVKNKKTGKLKIGGTALKETVSHNKRKYTIDEIKKNDDKEVKVFVEHKTNKSPVGKVKLIYNENEKKLLHEGWIKNTSTYPDIVENVADGLYDVSIGANGTLIKESTGTYLVKNLDIKEMSLVGLAGVEGAGIEYAVAESFKINEIVGENMKEAKLTYKQRKKLPSSAYVFPKEKKYPIHDLAHARNALARVATYGTPEEKRKVIEAVCKKYPQLPTCKERTSEGCKIISIEEFDFEEIINEVDKMDKLKKIQKENEELKKKINEMELKRKESLVESILKLNDKFKKEELIEKSESELNIIKEYEMKLKEQDSEEEKSEEDGEGKVEDEEEKSEESDDIIVTESYITMSDKLYEKFNKEIKESIYR